MSEEEDQPTRYRAVRPVSKREVWEAVKEQDQSGELEGVVDLVKGLADRFGIKTIEVETARRKIRWRS